ncbi:MAG: EF-hand domain-containing protein [Pseudomonadota bacterium]
MLYRTLLITALSTAVLTGIAVASPGEYEHLKRGPVPYEAFDRDHDDAISAEEFAETHAQRVAVRSEAGYPMRHAKNAPTFEQLDIDGNGSISREEHRDWQTQRMQQRRGMGKGPRWAQ